MGRGAVRWIGVTFAVPAVVLLAGGASRGERQAASLPAAIGAHDSSFSVTADGGRLVARTGGLSAVFGGAGVAIRTAGGAARLSLVGLGVGDEIATPAEATPVDTGNEVEYRRPGLTEWYRNGPLGLEQGFEVDRRPPGARGGDLTLVIRPSSSLRPTRRGSEIDFERRAGGPALLSYGALSAVDARGRTLPSRLALSGGRMLLEIDDRGASYPVTVYPLIQEGSKFTPGDESSAASFGTAIAVSSDGTMALVGGPDDGAGGAVWVFTRSESEWTEEAKLNASDESMSDSFGASVSLSADGNTALIGAPEDAEGVGAAWVFTRSGSTWTQQGLKLTPSGVSGTALFGASVSLSADGNTAIIGGPEDNSGVGAAWVYTRSGSTWSQHGAKLVPSGAVGSPGFGQSVAMAADASFALIGGPQDFSDSGAFWMFTPGADWTQDGSANVAPGSGYMDFGHTLALSGDTNTVIIGAPGDSSGVGSAFAYTRSGSTWSYQPGLSVNGEVGIGEYGSSVAVSSDGSTALVGGSNDNSGEGAAWSYTRSGGTWSGGTKLTPSDGSGAPHFGSAVALESDGAAGVIGGPNDSSNAGAAWFFGPQVVLGTTGNVASAVENGPPVTIDPGMSVSDTGSSSLDSATVEISDGLSAGDVLSSTTSGTISASYSAGTLTLTGTDTLAHYQTVLDSVAFQSTSGTGGPRTITWTADDGTDESLPVDSEVDYSALPGAPTAPFAARGDGQATVSFSPPASDGGAAISSYTVTAAPGGAHASGAGSPLTVTGLTNGTSYTFTVAATNAAGQGPASVPSNAVVPAGFPSPPGTPSATAGNGQATVSFAGAAQNGSAITTYTVTASPGGAQASGAGSPITVTGLSNGTAYTFTVTATNGVGQGAASSASNAVAPITVPGAPNGVTASAGDGQATVAFSPPGSNGGSAISSYTATASPGGAHASGSASPLTVTGLTDGVTYTFSVVATNGAGTGASSAASNQVTPAVVVTTTTTTTTTTSTSTTTSGTTTTTTPATTPAAASTTTPTTTTTPITTAPTTTSATTTTTTTSSQTGSFVVVDESIGGISIGMTEKTVVLLLGAPQSTLTLSLGNGTEGKIVHYHYQGGVFVVTYDSNGQVVAVETYSTFFHTSGGVGPGSALTLAAALHGFRPDYCELGYWNGSASTSGDQVVTIFTPNGGLVDSVLITKFSFYTVCRVAPPPPTPHVSLPAAVVLDHSIGGVSIGMTQAEVIALFGKPATTLDLALGGGKKGLLARYRLHGAAFIVTYDSTGRVISIEAYAPFFRTNGGLGLGPGSPLTLVAAVHGFHVDFCELGYWNGTSHTGSTHVITVFTPSGGVVASILITQFRLYTACNAVA